MIFVVPLPAVRTFVVFWLASNAYVVLLGLGMLLARYDPFTRPRFSLLKYYVLMGWAPLAFAALALLVSARYLVFFLVMGLAGIGGELVVSLLWRGFFREPIWTYNHGAKLAGYTSTINFLPWAVGAFWFHSMAAFVNGPHREVGLRPVVVSAVAFALGMLVAWPSRRATSAREGRFTRRAFALFCLPIVATGLALTLACGPRYLALMATFSLVGFLTEYAYGRTMSFFFEKSLWRYNHWQIDSGHTSFVTLPLWALGGLYFYFISSWLGV